MIKDEPLGIPSEFLGAEYILIPQGQNPESELPKIAGLLLNIREGSSIPEFQNKQRTIQFINWGFTELVYVLKVGEKKYTLLVGQPTTEFGEIRRECNNLKRLANRHKQDVIKPLYYVSNERSQTEAYITPYFYQARCIADREDGWGLYIPEPEYHFKVFSKEQRRIVNACMIAKLVQFYDEKDNLGLASCHLGGGDFILEKGFEDEPLTYENNLKRMKLIAAREFVKMPLEQYCDTIRREFTESKFNEFIKTDAVINSRSDLPMTKEEIEDGIELGMKLRSKEKEKEDGESR